MPRAGEVGRFSTSRSHSTRTRRPRTPSLHSAEHSRLWSAIHDLADLLRSFIAFPKILANHSSPSGRLRSRNGEWKKWAIKLHECEGREPIFVDHRGEVMRKVLAKREVRKWQETVLIARWKVVKIKSRSRANSPSIVHRWRSLSIFLPTCFLSFPLRIEGTGATYLMILHIS